MQPAGGSRKEKRESASRLSAGKAEWKGEQRKRQRLRKQTSTSRLSGPPIRPPVRPPIRAAEGAVEALKIGGVPAKHLVGEAPKQKWGR